MWCSVSSLIQTTPGDIMYGRDMIIDVPLIEKLVAICDGRQQMINENLTKQNKK